MRYIKVFTDFVTAIEPLGDAECGRLFRAMLEYAETGNAPELGGNERFIWPTARLQIDRGLKSYENTCERNRRNRNGGGQPSPTVTSGDQMSRHVIREEEDKDKEKEKKEKRKETDAQNAGGFDLFWAAYPKKKAKADAQKAWRSVKPDLAVVLAALERERASPDWQKEGGKYIPYPATWLRGRRWEDEQNLTLPQEEGHVPVIHEAPPEWEHSSDASFLEILGVKF